MAFSAEMSGQLAQALEKAGLTEHMAQRLINNRDDAMYFVLEGAIVVDRRLEAKQKLANQRRAGPWSS